MAPQPESQSRTHVSLLFLLVLSAIVGVYFFFQSAPEAELYVFVLAVFYLL